MKGSKPKKMPFNRGQQGMAPGGTATKSPKAKSASGGKGRGSKGRGA
jgi:hypothetical protein